jgi:hypothetical protein
VGGVDGVDDGVTGALVLLAEGEGVGEGLLVDVTDGVAVGEAATVGDGVAVAAVCGAADAGPATTMPASSVVTTAVTASQERTRVRG